MDAAQRLREHNERVESLTKLERAALDALTTIAELAEAPHWQQGRRWEIARIAGKVAREIKYGDD